MPLRRGSNGGWQRVSQEQLDREAAAASAVAADVAVEHDRSQRVLEQQQQQQQQQQHRGRGREREREQPREAECRAAPPSPKLRAGDGGQKYGKNCNNDIRDHFTDHGNTATGTVAAETTTTTATASWALEGIRRVRADAVHRRMRCVAIMAAIGGFLFGYDTGVMSGAMLPLQRQFHLTAWQQEMVVSATVLAAFMSSFLAGDAAQNRWGRRGTLQTAAAFFVAGSTVLASAWSLLVLIIGRLLIGCAIGLASFTIPVYIAEVAVPQLRGRLVTVNALMVTVGQFLAGMVDGWLDQVAPNQGWRAMLGLAILPSLVLYVAFRFYMPESPRWLIQQGRTAEAMKALQWMRESDDDAHQECQAIQEIIIEQQQQQQKGDGLVRTTPSMDLEATVSGEDAPARNAYTSSVLENKAYLDDDELDPEDYEHENGMPQPTDTPSIVVGSQSNSNNSFNLATMMHDANISIRQWYQNVKAMWRDTPTRRALYVGCTLMFLQQACGINTVMYYAATIYKMSQYSEQTAFWLSGFTALAQVVGIVISLFLVDRVGRRTLVLISLVAVTFCCMGLGASFYLLRITSEPIYKSFGSSCQQLSHAWVWSGKTEYALDCAALDHCGWCGHMCMPGTVDGPDDVDLCPPATTWHYSGTNSSNGRSNDDGDSHPYAWLTVICMVLYLFSFGIGMGGLPWTIHAEIYPLRHRNMAISFSTATNWFSNAVVTATFLSLSQPSALTVYGAFWLYAAIAAVGFAVLYIILPETKGLSLEDMERLFTSRRRSNHTDDLQGGGVYWTALDNSYDDDDDDDDDDDNDDSSTEAPEPSFAPNVAVGMDYAPQQESLPQQSPLPHSEVAMMQLDRHRHAKAL